MLARPYQPVAFQGRGKRPTSPANQLRGAAAAVPGIEQARTGLEVAFRYDLDEQGLEMRVLGQLVLFGGINAVVSG